MKQILGILLLAGSALGQDRPTVTNAQFEARAYPGHLKSLIDSDSPSWFGYAFTSSRKDDQSCCYSNNTVCGCRLEGNGETHITGSSSQNPVKLEGTPLRAVLFRMEHHSLERVNIYSLSCPLDAGGLPFIWLDKVPSSDSLAFLSSLAVPAASEKVIDGAILAIAQHEDRAADGLLARFSAAPNPDRTREKAIFWLGAARGDAGIPILKSLIAQDPSDHIRDKAVFALYVSNRPEATEELLTAAKNDPSPHVREQALFWLAQRAGDRAAAAIVNAINNDPDTHVKERAVFALSQLPKDEGIPKLIEVARNQRNPEVQKKAFFWLGQSHDPRALAFIEQVLTR